jgi:hypothetical protein
MKNLVLFRKLILFLPAMLIIANLQAKEVFVKPNASGTGESWNDAANISYITGSSIAEGDVVYVAEGEYLRTTQLSVTKYITIKGGYSANSVDTDLTQRDVQLYKSVFKPDGGTSRAININITSYPLNTKMVVDGLHFENFNGTSQGAAMIITTSQGDIDLKNLTFKNNTVTNSLGGALAMPTAYAAEISITLDGCRFESNQALFTTGNGYGGAFYFNNTTSPKTINIRNSVFINNYAYGRGAAGYFGTNLTVNISDCTFDSNQCTATTDNLSNGGCFYIVGTAGYGSTFNIDRSVFVNSYVTGKGSVIWFNNTSGSLINYLNVNNSSMIGNYSSRTTSGRAAIDVDNYSTQLQFKLKNSVLSNYNNIGQVKSSRYADVMFVNVASSTSDCTFENSILNGTYFSSGNVLASISPPDTLYNKQHGYLSDSTINLALEGDLVITDKIMFKKSFTASHAGVWIHSEIFDVKKKLNLPMTLNVVVPAGYKLEVDGQSYAAGTQSIAIPASTADPVVELKLLSATSHTQAKLATAATHNGVVMLSGMEPGSRVEVYTQSGQLLFNQIVHSNNFGFEARGFRLVKVTSQNHSQVIKVISN